MQLYTDFPFSDLAKQRSFLDDAEFHGYDGVFGTENRQGPLLSIAASVHRQQRLSVGTGVLALLAHNPFNIAQMAWDLHYNSGEKFILGVCTHQDVHLEHRLGVGSDSKHDRLVDSVAAIREIWSAWQEEREPSFESREFSIRVCPQGFRPLTRIETVPQIYLLCTEHRDIEIASDVADGIFMHPIWNADYFQKIVLPLLTGKEDRIGQVFDLPIISGQIIATGMKAEDRRISRHHARQRVAGYWSQEKYDSVFRQADCLDEVTRFRQLGAHHEETWEDDCVQALYTRFVCDVDPDDLASGLSSTVPAEATGVFPNVMSAIPRLLPPEVVQSVQRLNIKTQSPLQRLVSNGL